MHREWKLKIGKRGWKERENGKNWEEVGEELRIMMLKVKLKSWIGVEDNEKVKYEEK